MSRATSNALLGVLRTHASDIFISLCGAAQMLLEQQLLEQQRSHILFILGSYGNAGRVTTVATLLGLTPRAVLKCTRRVVKGLLRTASHCMTSPDAPQRAALDAQAGTRYGFPRCI